MAAIADDGQLRITDRTLAVLEEQLGSMLIRNLQYRWSWAIMARVGADRPIAEDLSEQQVVSLQRLISLPFTDY